MSRISNSSFKVNSDLEQITEIGSVASGVSFPITTASDLGVNLKQVSGSSISLGQQTKGSCLPVVMASDVDAGVDLNKVGGTAVSLGETTAASSIPVVLASDKDVGVKLETIEATAKGSDSTLSTALQAGIYGYDGSNWRQVNVSTGGNLKVENELENHSGSQGNLENAGSVTSGDVSTAIDVSNSTLVTIFGNTNDTANPIDIQVSANGSNYYPMNFQIYPDGSGNFFESINDICVNNIRLKFNGTATVTATLLHNNH